jgi:hypothetical protein
MIEIVGVAVRLSEQKRRNLPSQKGRFRGKASAISGSRRLPIHPFSRNLFPIAFSRNGPSEMEKRDCCEKFNGWLRDAAPI